MEKNKFNYDEFSDRLFIATKKTNEEIDGSLRVLDIVLDFTIDGRIANVELIDASNYLESLDINSKILNSLNNANFVVKKLRNGYLITFILESKGKTSKIPYGLHIPTEKKMIVTP